MNLRLAPLMAALLCACATPAFADPVISEFLAANSEVLADEDGEYSDWIEIHNPGSAAIDLGGYYLSDNPNAPAKWAFPSPTPLAADGYLIVFASGKDRALSGSELHTNFRLNNGGESVLLVAPDGTAVVSAFDPYPQQQSDRSYGVAQRVITASYLDEAIPQILVPAQESDLAADWANPGFAGGGLWVAGVAPPAIGFDTAEPPVTLKNVAPTGTATQTSTHQAGPPERAIDGDLTNFSHTASPNPGEWRLDLPGPEEIHQIIIHNRDNCCPERMRDISFDILDEGGTVIFSSQLLNAENALGSPPFIEIDVFAENGDAPVAGKSVIVRRAPDLDHSGAPGQTSNDDAYVLAMGEFIVMAEDIAAEPPDPLVIRNLAPEGTASQSSTNGAFTADRAIDGEVGNFTHTLASDLDPTWTLDLGKVSLINELIIRNRGDGCCPSRLRDITVSILDTDGTTVVWESELLNPENADGGPTLIDLELDGLAGSAVVGQFVRIHRTPDPDLSGGAGNEDEGYVLSLGEVEVLGISVDSYDPFITTDLEAAAAGQSASAFMRIPFQVDDPGALETLALDIQYDDGFIAYLNGTEIAARNAPASPAWDSAAAAERLDTDAVRVERIDLTAQLALLTAGENVLAFHALNASASDDDFLLRPRLTSTADGGQLNAYMEPPTPGAPNTSGFFIDRVADTKFSLNRGIYDDPIEVEITTATEGATIRYTVDGSKPSETNGAIYAGPISLSQTTVLRAIAYREDWRSTDVDTHTYLFLADVITQATMDTGITQSAIYGPQMQDALRSLPAVSLVFAGDIDRTEKETSVELIGFENGDLQVNAGMERYGAYATNFAKRNVRLNFRDRWGPKKLNYPLFDGHGGGRDPVTEFDALDLRMGSHDMKQRGFYLSNRFCDDTMMQMGHVSPHYRFVHLYVNWNLLGAIPSARAVECRHARPVSRRRKGHYEAIAPNRGGVPWSVGLPYDGDGSAANILSCAATTRRRKTTSTCLRSSTGCSCGCRATPNTNIARSVRSPPAAASSRI
ncbi:MAG: discoidin domain-containing protein [Verrucomicrobiales bacterium]